MQAFDVRTGVPDWWSLAPEETHSLVFWTKVPKNLVADYALLSAYKVKVHVTITGWEEVERGAPNIETATQWASNLSDLVGRENLSWRFSPVPILSSVRSLYQRFESIASRMTGKTNSVYLSFLQPNDMIPETRSATECLQIMRELAQIADAYRIRVRLCNVYKDSLDGLGAQQNLSAGVCVPCEGEPKPQSESCGCAIMVDPFTFNESCTLSCGYCYASDKSLSPKKSNSTKGLVVIP
jgi:hypothetical protein